MSYIDRLKEAYDSVPQEDLDLLYNTLCCESEYMNPALFFGNGGSAAVANHVVTDLVKGLAEDSDTHCFEALSLCSNVPLITAIANDLGYDKVFSKQMEYLNFPDAIAVAVSSSGNSPNVLEGLKYARSKGYITVALVGFEGGEVLKQGLADVLIHVKADNYGIVEDCHMAILHELAQRLRTSYADDPSSLKL